MIDFKKEVLKYQPAKTVEDMQDGIIVSEIKDISDLLQSIAGVRKADTSAARE